GFQVAYGTRGVGGCVVGVAVVITLAFRCGAGSGCRQQPADVLDHHEPGLQRLDRGRHVRLEPGTGAGCEAGAFADGRDVLAREAAAEDVYRRHCGPVDGRDIAEVRGSRPVVGEHARDGGVELREPDRLPTSGVFDGQI